MLIDLALVLFLFLQTWLGWRSGLLWQATALVSICLGIFLGLVLSPFLAEGLMARVTSDPFHAQFAAFLFVIGTVGLLLRILATWAEVHSETGLPRKEREQRRGHDRVLGGIFGALKGMVASLLVMAMLVSLWPDYSGWDRSFFTPRFATAGGRMLPSGMLKEVRGWMVDSQKAVSQTLQLKVSVPGREPASILKSQQTPPSENGR